MMSITLSTVMRVANGMTLTSGLSALSVRVADSTLLWIPAAELDAVLIAGVLQALPRQDRAQPGLAVQHDRRRGVGHCAGDPKLEEPTADIGGTVDVAVPVFVGVTDVDHGQRLAGFDPPLDLLGALLGHGLPCLGDHLLERLHRADGNPNSS